MKNILKFTIIIQLTSQPLFAVEKTNGGIKRFDGVDNVTPAEQAKQNKIKKDSCTKQGKVWAPGDGVSKEWGCYDPEVKINTIKPEADPSCDEAFINKLIAQDGCFINGNASDCVYLGALSSMGILGVKSGYDALFQLSMAKSKDLTFLKNYKKIYDTAIDNKRKYAKLVNFDHRQDALALQKIFKDIFDKDAPVKKTNQTYSDYINMLTQKIENHLSSGKMSEEQLVNKRYYDSEHYYRLELAMNKARVEAFSELVQENPDLKKILTELEAEKYDRLYLKELKNNLERAFNALIEKLLPHEYGELKKLKAKRWTNAFRERNETPEYIEKNNNMSDLHDKAAGDLRSNTLALINNLRSEIAPIERAIFDKWEKAYFQELRGNPKLYLLQVFTDEEPEINNKFKKKFNKRSAIFEEQALKEARRSGIKGGAAVGAAGLGLSVAGMPTLNMVSDNQLNLCSKSLNLSTDEVNLLYEESGLFRGTPKNVKNGRLSDCQSYRLTNISDVLTKSQAQFGYIPKGICQMAQKLNQKQEVIARDAQPKEVSCNNVKGDNYSLNMDANGNGKLVCISSTKKVYSIPYNLYNGADYSKVSALNTNGEPDILSAITFKDLAGGEKYMYVATGRTQFMPTSQSTISDCLESEGSVPRTNNQNIFCSCVKQAQTARAILFTQQTMPDCKDKNSDTLLNKDIKPKSKQ